MPGGEKLTKVSDEKCELVEITLALVDLSIEQDEME